MQRPGPNYQRAKRLSHAVLEALEPRRLLSTDIVTNLADSGAGSLRQTLASAAPGDTVQFASGLTGTLTLTSGELNLNQNVTITGPGTSSLSISGGNNSTVFNVSAGVSASISGLTITEGFAGPRGDGGDIDNTGTLSLSSVNVNLGSAELGGGLYNAGSVIITNSVFSSNTAGQLGGAILNAANGIITATGATFTSNSTVQEAGGAICNENATLSLTNSTLTANTSGTYGGAISNFALGTLIINNSTLSNNTADLWGGAIFNFTAASLTITNATISNNKADDIFGGGIYNYQGTADITGAVLSNNTSDYGGGAIASFLGTLAVSGCTISNNGNSTTQTIGGGIYTLDYAASITNSTISGNKSQYGAGVFEDGSGSLVISGTTLSSNIASQSGGAGYIDGTLYIDNSTIASNQATYGAGLMAIGTITAANVTIASNLAGLSAGGIYINSGDTTIYNSIVANNTLSNGKTASNIVNTLDASLASGETASSYNLVGSGGTGGLTNGTRGNIVGANPLLGALQNNGGPTNTMAIPSNSPAINTGSVTFAKSYTGAALTTDQRGSGFPRTIGSTVDIGAYEYEGSSPSVSGPIVGQNSPAVSGAKIPGPPAPPGSGSATPSFEIDPDVSPATGAYTPTEVRDAYGVNDILFNGVTGNGSGETIAIVDAYNDPDIMSDANTFSSDFGLPTFNSGGPTLQVLNQTGGATLPTNSVPGQWDVEESLDVEWAHAIAPDANIILFEANSASDTDLFTAIATAADWTGVSVVSMSFNSYELYNVYGGVEETSTDSTFTTPTGHQGVTFLGAAGDQGAPAVGYPSLSPNVISVGGTSLLVGTDDSYLGESAWSGGGGGISLQESLPSYQIPDALNWSFVARTGPDVSMDADPETGVLVVDSFDGGSFQIGGTSLATPMWAALIAIVNQGRALKGETSLDGASQTLPMLYGLPSTDFHDITTGNNGYPAVTGYDLATGLGSPIANLLVPNLAGYDGTAVWTGLVSNNWFVADNWNTFSVPNSTTDVIINFGNPTAATPIDVAALTINGGTLQLATGGGSSTVASVTIDGNGILDLTNNKLFIDYGSTSDPIASIYTWLTTGYNNGAWNGPGIDSSAAAQNPSYALGFADGADNVVSGLAAGEIEIAFTLYGDANLDGTVNGSDFSILAANFGMGTTDWDEGNFRYNGVVNGSDFSALAVNFGLAASQAAVSLPVFAAAASTTSTDDSTTLKLLTPSKNISGGVMARLAADPPVKTTPPPKSPKQNRPAFFTLAVRR